MKQAVLHYLSQLGISPIVGQDMIRKAQQYYGWKLRPDGSVERAVEWVMQGAYAYDITHQAPPPGLVHGGGLPPPPPPAVQQQNKKQIIKGISQLLGITQTHAKYIIKYVEEKYKTKIDPNVDIDSAITFILHRYDQNEFLNVASGNPDYYQFMLQFSPGNVPKGMTQKQLQALQTIKYKDYKSRKKQSQKQQKLTECNICIEEFKPEDTIVESVSCPHIFHEKCAKKWFKINKACPICKKQIV